MQLKLQSLTWINDSYSLFDYDAKQLSVESYLFEHCSSPITIYRNHSGMACPNVIAIDQNINNNLDNNLDLDQYELLTQFLIKRHYKDFVSLQFANSSLIQPEEIYQPQPFLEHFNQFEQREEVYFVARRPKNNTDYSNGLKLQVGQTIKLGKVMLFVSEVCFRGKTSISKKYNEKIYANKLIKKYVADETKTEDGQSKVCKYCMSEIEDKDNFLFNPCKCSGSCGTVHIECLLKWIQAKVKKEAIGGTMHFSFNKSACEICKAQFPVVVETEEGKTIELLPFEKPKGDYMILQGASGVSERVLMIKNLPEGGIKIGRGNDCQIRFTEVTVSRNHAFIRLRQSGFYIYDNKSKFGTLVRRQRMRIDVGMGCQQCIQIGRTIIILEIRQKQKQKNERYELKYSSNRMMKELW